MKKWISPLGEMIFFAFVLVVCIILAILIAIYETLYYDKTEYQTYMTEGYKYEVITTPFYIKTNWYSLTNPDVIIPKPAFIEHGYVSQYGTNL